MATQRQKDLRTWRRQNALIADIEKPFVKEVFREKNRYIRASELVYAAGGGLPADLLSEHTVNLRRIMEKYYARTIRIFIGEAERNLPKMKQDLFHDTFQEWLAFEGGKKIADTAQTTQNDIKKAIARAIADEKPTTEVLKSILSVQGLSRWRASTIAETETHNAAMYASKRTAENISSNAGIEILKKWIPAVDERTRTNHAVMTRHEPVLMDGHFTVGGEKLDRPGDPRGSAKNIIRCRCVMTYIRR